MREIFGKCLDDRLPDNKRNIATNLPTCRVGQAGNTKEHKGTSKYSPEFFETFVHFVAHSVMGSYKR